MIVAWSQIDASNQTVFRDLVESLFQRRWAYAIPIPIFFALSGTLVGRWFSDFDELAAIAANLVVSAVILIPATFLISHVGSDLQPNFRTQEQELSAVLLLLLGTLAAAAAGRVYYQVALTTTNNDNGFVTMFFLDSGVFLADNSPAFLVDPRFAPCRGTYVLSRFGYYYCAFAFIPDERLASFGQRAGVGDP